MEPRQDSVSFASVGGEAVMHAECPICLEDLCDPEFAPVAVLAGHSGHRVCRHFYHHKCALELRGIDGRGYAENVEIYDSPEAQVFCPLCRVGFARALPLPDPFHNLDSWFNIVDMSGEGCISKTELLDVISATLAVDQGKAPELIDKYWHSWDVNGTESITPDELGNLLPFLKKFLPRRARPDPPFLPEAPHAWFDYWDEDDNGSLSTAEVTRAIAKTLGASPEKACDLVENLWCLFDFSGSDSVTKREFVARKGLAEMMCAALAQDKSLKRRVNKALKEQPLPRPRLAAAPVSSPTVQEAQIEVGDRVRDIMTGTTGVVTSMGGAMMRDFVIDFPMRRNVTFAGTQLELLSRAATITEGSQVRIASDVAMPRYGWGLLNRLSQGVVTRITGYRVRVRFPEQDQWYGVLGELELVPGGASPGSVRSSYAEQSFAGSRVHCPRCTALNEITSPQCSVCEYTF